MKKYLLATLALFVLVFLTLPVPAKAEQSGSSAMIAQEGAPTAADAARMLRVLCLTPAQADDYKECDLTQNGTVNVNDVRAGLMYACGGISDWEAFAERLSTGLLGEKYLDHFYYAGVYDDLSGNYRSANVSVTILRGRMFDNDYSLADIYVQDIACIVTAFSGDKYIHSAERMETMLGNCEGGIVAINGDYYVLHDYGPVIRNGVVYRENITRGFDVCVLSMSGELLTFPYGKLKKDILAAANPYQTWAFGPALLDEYGCAKTEFRSNVQSENPRSVIGCFEPGHYAFLAVDGRSDISEGMTMRELSLLCQALGLTSAYNLDGGRSSVLQSKSGPINQPYAGGRPSSDSIVVRDLSAD